MNLSEYARYDALGLAELVANKHVSPTELARIAATAIAAINPAINAVVETYPDRIDDLDERTLGTGPFRGVPFLIKDFFGHEAGRTIEFGSRLCRGMVAQHDTYLCELFKASGVNILGRSAAPEYSMCGTTESALHGMMERPAAGRHQDMLTVRQAHRCSESLQAAHVTLDAVSLQDRWIGCDACTPPLLVNCCQKLAWTPGASRTRESPLNMRVDEKLSQLLNDALSRNNMMLL